MSTVSKIHQLLASKFSQRVIFVLGLVFLVGSVLIYVAVEPFMRFGYIGIFVFNLFGPGTLIIPRLVQVFNPLLVALVSSVGMSFNDSVAWVVGHSGNAVIANPHKYKKFERMIEKYGFWSFLLLSILPFPFDFIGGVAGYIGMSYRSFFVPTCIGKFIRFLVVGYVTLGVW